MTLLAPRTDVKTPPHTSTNGRPLGGAGSRKGPRRLPSISTVLYSAGVALILLLCIVGPYITPFSPVRVVAAPDLPPGPAHWFGTDSTGMDVFSRTVAGFQYDVVIGLSAALLSTIAGMAVGAVSAVLERSTHPLLRGIGQTVLRALDLFQAIPAVIVGLVLVAFFGPSLVTLILAMVVANGPPQARLVRAEVLRVSGEVFIENAVVSGESPLTRTFRYILPNSAWPAIENMTLVFATSISLVAGLGFLGVGLAPPTPEWGSMIATEQTGVLAGRWWGVVFPALAMLLTTVFMVALNRRLTRQD